jgi:transcriptional regulator with XRE-family HTH domain
MSQQKKLEFPERVREFRGRAKLSQDDLGERLGVSGNYISMLELGKKAPGPSLRKLFESIEQSPLYRAAGGSSGWELRDSTGGSSAMATNPLWAMLSTETLIQSFSELAAKLSVAGTQRQVIGNLRELLDELERRLLASSGGLSEAQQMAVKAAKPGGSRGTE